MGTSLNVPMPKIKLPSMPGSFKFVAPEFHITDKSPSGKEELWTGILTGINGDLLGQKINFNSNIGFSDDEIKIGVIDYTYKEFRNEEQILVDKERTLIGTITIETNQVNLVPIVRTKMNELLAEGISVVNNAPSYTFTKLKKITDLYDYFTTNILEQVNLLE